MYTEENKCVYKKVCFILAEFELLFDSIENRIADACYSCMPHTFTDVSNQVANGVEIEKVPVEAQKCFQSLPAIDWAKTKNSSGVETIQLTPESVKFWLKPKSTDASEHQQRELNTTLDDFKIFNDLQNPLRNSRAFAKCTNGDKGNASQMVRYEECMVKLFGILIIEFRSMISRETRNCIWIWTF